MSIQIHIPAGLQLSQFELRMMLASKLFEQGHISTGQGAEMVGLSKRAFIELLGKYGVSVFQYSIEEIESDLTNA